tara:strand:- start:87 stop:1490 length:1404 start_codon:yes stop_codon:yes gene_type:complete
MSRTVKARNSEPIDVDQLEIFSNPNQRENVSLSGGLVRLQYWESILQDTVRAAVVFADSGNSINDKSVVDGLPVVGQERVVIKITDHNGVQLDFSGDSSLYVNKVTPIDNDSTKSMTHLDLVSKEYIMNEKIRLNKRFDGKISESIDTILTDEEYLNTQKDVEIDITSNNFNFIGNNRKPFYTLNWLSKRGVPNSPQAGGNTAGFLFWETSEGFKFKSIDNLLDTNKNPQQKSIIFNQSVDKESIPAGYDVKALEYSVDNKINVQDKLKMGTYSNRIVTFDPFTCFYEVVAPNAGASSTPSQNSSGPTNIPGNQRHLTTAGRSLPLLNKEFDREGNNQDFTRTTYVLLDKGVLPIGNDAKEQLKKSKDPNFIAKMVLNQSIMRMNQLFSAATTVTIPGDFSLHAGQSVFVDAPSLESDTSNDEVNDQSGGLYIIADLCHFITPKETYTKLNLIRDSFGRTGNHSTGR